MSKKKWFERGKREPEATAANDLHLPLESFPAAEITNPAPAPASSQPFNPFKKEPDFARPPFAPIGPATLPETIPTTLLGNDIQFKGQLTGKGSVQIGGTFEGNIKLEQKVIILKEGNVKADIEADTVIVQGKLSGNISSRSRTILEDNGEMIGDISTDKIIVQKKAIFKGRIMTGGAGESGRQRLEEGRLKAPPMAPKEAIKSPPTSEEKRRPESTGGLPFPSPSPPRPPFNPK